MSVARYYAWLSRFQDGARLFAHDTGQHTFTVHRRLRGEAGEVSGGVLHERLLQALHATDDAATPATLDGLDAGCGLGGTISPCTRGAAAATWASRSAPPSANARPAKPAGAASTARADSPCATTTRRSRI